MNILNEVEKILKTNNKYVSSDNKLLKAKVYEDVMNTNKDLLSLLLTSDTIKKHFFENIDGVLVFDKQKFAWFIESKEFLPDSYTSYTNKIGLTKDGSFISKSNDVVLDFPYKDCILEGGQDKDDQKRDEIFYHEIIAGDKITRMLSPKVFTNAKRFIKDKVEENIEFDEKDNLIIKGNNLIALSCLLKRYEGKVKCIYIDPPYNTQNDSFNYNDSFNHSTWLTFMKNRLEFSKRLLSDEGVIFVQCDDNEQAYLKVLMDNIFGRENFIATIPRKTRGSATTKSDAEIETLHDYVQMYALSKKYLSLNKFIIGEKEYKYEDKKGKYYIVPLQDNGPHGTRTARPRLYYPIYVDKNGKCFLENINNELIEILPKTHKNDDGRWMWGKEKFLKDNEDLEFINDKIYIKHYYNKNEDQNKYRRFRSWLDSYQNLNGTKTLNEVFNKKGVFNNPKPEELIHSLLYIATNQNDLVLDFHLGSGTTAAVAHKMGRRYIGIEQMDYIEDITVERLKKVIDGEQGGISKSVDWQGGGSFVYCELLEDANNLIKEIKNTDETSINSIKEKVYKDERIVPYIQTSELEKVDNYFNNLSLEDKKNALIMLVDKNKLYVNLSEMDDSKYNVSDSDKKFTKSFYKQV